jgi:hypothetical protein
MPLTGPVTDAAQLIPIGPWTAARVRASALGAGTAAVKAPRLTSLSCRNVAASLPPESPDNEGLYKKMKRHGIS